MSVMGAAGEIQCSALEKVIFGKPAAEALAEQVDAQGAQRVFLIASKTLSDQTDEIDKVRDALGSRLAGIYTGMPAHTPRQAVIEAAGAARAVDTDLLVTLGGGSVTDAGKVVLVALTHNVRDADGLEPFHVRVEKDGTVVHPEFEGPAIRSIAIPTTLSGGEFNPLGGATDLRKNLKEGYEHRDLAPHTVILDPALTRHTPDWLWFSTGVRAMDHAIETLASLQSNPYCDGLADSALRLLVDGLRRVKQDPVDIEARLNCQIGMWQSMVPVVSGVPMGASHAIGHVLGGACDVPHGYTSCVMSPYVLAFNEPANADRQKRISACFGDPNRPASELADGYIRALGMPRTLAAVNVGEERFEEVAQKTMHDFWARTNPRPVSEAADILQILQLAK
eukprot:s1_g1974.t1